MKNIEFKYAHEGVVCLCCGRVLISYFTHDYKTCPCDQQTMVDGGQLGYVRYGGKDLSLIRHVLIVPVVRTKSGKTSKRRIKTYREVYANKRR
jgi:hypothetical protein